MYYVVTAIALLAVATAIQFTGFTTVYLWAIEAAFLIWSGTRWQKRWVWASALILFGAAILKALLSHDLLHMDPIESFTVIRNTRALALAILTAGLAFAKHPKVAADLNTNDPNASVDVIVQFKQAPTYAHHKKVADRGGKHKANLEAVKAGLYSMRADRLDDLARDPDVVYISPDRPVRAFLDYANSTVGADIARRYGWEGAGVGVAVIDSGINNVWDLKVGTSYVKSRIVYNESFLTTIRTNDEFGHGTHVAGILAGNANYSATVANAIQTVINN